MDSGRVDLHLHLLPGLDDGPETTEASLELAEAMAALGYTHLCATPHQWEGMWLPSTQEMEHARQAVAEAIEAAGLQVELYLGAEHHVEYTLMERLNAGSLLTLGPGRAVLLELPGFDVPSSFEPMLFELQTRGYLTLLAHPERHQELMRDRTRLESLRERGLGLQLCLTSLGGKMGRKVARQATKLLRDGLYELAGSDAHSADEVGLFVEPALEMLESVVGAKEAWCLCATRPAMLLGLGSRNLPSQVSGL